MELLSDKTLIEFKKYVQHNEFGYVDIEPRSIVFTFD